jgi:molybdopterin-binding protein
VVTGTVTDTSSNPLQGVYVEIFTTGANPGVVAAASTASDGTYTVAGLAAGTYNVCFEGNYATGGSSTTGYVEQCYRGVTWDGYSSGPIGATGVTVTAGAIASNIDASLSSGGVVTGTVTDTSSNPLQGVYVEIITTGANPEGVGFTTTGTNGSYAVVDLPAGSYDVCFIGSSATGGSSTTGYTDQCYDDVSWDGGYSDLGGTAVVVTAGSTRSGIDANLTAGGAISGMVTDTTSAPLEGVDVEVFTTGANPDNVGYGTTTADGSYTVGGLPTGSYDVCFQSTYATGGVSPGGYFDQCYNDVTWDGSYADPSGKAVAVTAGSTTPAVDASLIASGSVSGRVTDTAAAPLEGVEVEVFTTGASVDEVGSASTTANGAYTVAGLSAGSYDVCFDGSGATGGSSPTGYTDQCYTTVAWDGNYTDPSGTAVPVTIGSTTSGIDVSLPAGGAISGTVTDTSAGPLTAVLVVVFSTGANPDNVGYAVTAANGAYTVAGLPAGSYDVCFDGSGATGGSSPTGYTDQCYTTVAWDGNYTDPSGTAVPVTVGSTTSGIDVSLPAGGAISGTVTDTSSGPLTEVSVVVFTTGANPDNVGYASTAANGTYTVAGLPAGSYDVCFDASAATGGSSPAGYVDQCYNNTAWDGDTTDISGAAAVAVTVGSTAVDISAVLASQ